jgi:16S rRNA (cytidine1402-2'-O)-methyltransferase
VDANPAGGRLVVVATPIGNLADVSERALEVLRSADALYCEDTRHTRVLLAGRGIDAGGRLASLHEHNEAERCAEVVARVAGGQTVALVSDAGTPLVSDPGARVVAAVAAAGGEVTTVPGPSAVLAALCVSALATDRFCFEGFFPRRAGERDERLAAWAAEERTIVFFESPRRLGATLATLAERFGARRAAVVREVTKLYEEVGRGTVAELAERFAGEVRGEVVVVLEGAGARPGPERASVAAALAERFAAGASTRDAVDAVVASLHVARREAYDLALEVRRAGEGPVTNLE